eukprot:173463-Pelagomonas_calceolata.AAC.5
MDVAERRFLMAGPGPAGLAAAGRRLFWAGQLPAAERCGTPHLHDWANPAGSYAHVRSIVVMCCPNSAYGNDAGAPHLHDWANPTGSYAVQSIVALCCPLQCPRSGDQLCIWEKHRAEAHLHGRPTPQAHVHTHTHTHTHTRMHAHTIVELCVSTGCMGTWSGHMQSANSSSVFQARGVQRALL